MANQQSHTSKPATDQKPNTNLKQGGTVGREIPDESKERHTEIAVEAGQKGSAAHRAKHPAK